jgi:hypothetical protein
VQPEVGSALTGTLYVLVLQAVLAADTPEVTAAPQLYSSVIEIRHYHPMHLLQHSISVIHMHWQLT